MSRVLVDVESTLWQRVKVKALERGVKLPEAVAQALRGWLSFDGGSGAGVTGEQPPAAERGATDRLSQEPVALDALPVRKTKAELQALVDAVPAQRPTATAQGPSPYERAVERRLRSAQDRLRTHPEDDSQDPSDDEGAGF